MLLTIRENMGRKEQRKVKSTSVRKSSRRAGGTYVQSLIGLTCSRLPPSRFSGRASLERDGAVNACAARRVHGIRSVIWLRSEGCGAVFHRVCCLPVPDE